MSVDRRDFVVSGIGSLAAILGMPLGKKAKNVPKDAITVITGVEQFDGVTRFYRAQIWVKGDKLRSREVDYVDVDDADAEEETSTSSESSDSSRSGDFWISTPRPSEPPPLSMLAKPTPGRRIEDIPE